MSNSFIALRQSLPREWGERGAHKRLRRELAWGLMKNCLKITSDASAMKRGNDEGGDIEGYRRGQNSSILAASDERLSMNVKHLPQVYRGRKQKICTLCSYRLFYELEGGQLMRTRRQCIV